MAVRVVLEEVGELASLGLMVLRVHMEKMVTQAHKAPLVCLDCKGSKVMLERMEHQANLVPQEVLEPQAREDILVLRDLPDQR